MKPYSDFAKAIHKEGYIFIAIFATVTFVLGSFSITLAWIGGICTVWCAYFFRNPERVSPISDDLIVSAADGGREPRPVWAQSGTGGSVDADLCRAEAQTGRP